MRGRVRGDAADTSVLSTFTIVVLVFGGMVGAYVWAAPGDSASEQSVVLGVNTGGPIASGAKSYVVSATARPLLWDALAFRLDETPLSYAAPPDDDFEFCIARGGDACAPRMPAGLVSPGDAILVFHSDAEGRMLRVLDVAAANRTILALPVV